MSGTNYNLGFHFLLLRCPVLRNGFEPLQYSHDGISHLSQGELLSDTDPWTTIEGDICPGLRRPFVPTLRTVLGNVWEFWGFGWVQIGPALHVQRRVRDRGIFQYAWKYVSHLCLKLEGMQGEPIGCNPSGPPPVGKVVSFKANLTCVGIWSAFDP